MNNVKVIKDLKCSLVTRESTKKPGSYYECIVIKITDSYEKVVFLEPAEQELIKISK